MYILENPNKIIYYKQEQLVRIRPRSSIAILAKAEYMAKKIRKNTRKVKSEKDQSPDWKINVSDNAAQDRDNDFTRIFHTIIQDKYDFYISSKVHSE